MKTPCYNCTIPRGERICPCVDKTFYDVMQIEIEKVRACNREMVSYKHISIARRMRNDK